VKTEVTNKEMKLKANALKSFKSECWLICQMENVSYQYLIYLVSAFISNHYDQRQIDRHC
jgi:hypothetical protein